MLKLGTGQFYNRSEIKAPIAVETCIEGGLVCVSYRYY
jgi:hypothetical protein